MNKKLSTAMLVLCLSAAPALVHAEVGADLQDCVNAGLEGMKKAPSQLQESKEAEFAKALNEARARMLRANGAGKRVVDFMTENKINVGFAALSIPAALGSDPSGRPVIVLSSLLPANPQAFAVLIARAASALMYYGEKHTAETEYMSVSVAVRTWLEMGGRKDSLPMIAPGYKDEVRAAELKLWLDGPGSETALNKIGEAAGWKTIPELQSFYDAMLKNLDPQDPNHLKPAIENELSGLEKANKMFIDFRIEEDQWMKRFGVH